MLFTGIPFTAGFGRLRGTPASAFLLLTCLLLTCPSGGVSAEAPLTLAAARTLALDRQPRLVAQQAGAQASRSQALQALSLPDPQLRIGVVNLPATGADAFSFSRDAMTMRMIGVMQAFPSARKRELASRRARLEGDAGDLETAFTRRAIGRDVALAWVDIHFARRGEALLMELDAEAQRQIDALLVNYRAGRASQADVESARVGREILADQRSQWARQEALARAELSRWIGEAAAGPLDDQLPPLPPPVALDAVLTSLQGHPHLSGAARQIDIAEAELDLARARNRPDWSLELSYGYREAADSDMVTVQVGIDLPFLQRKTRLHDEAGRVARVQQARALHADNIAEMRASARRLHAEWSSAMDRMQRFDKTLLPQASARIDASLASYRAGKGDLLAVLEARRMLLDLRLQRLALQADAHRAAFQIEYLRAPEGGRP